MKILYRKARKIIFPSFVLMVLSSVPLLAQGNGARFDDSFSLGSQSYVKTGNTWFTYHNGRVGDEVITDSLIIRNNSRTILTASELASYNLTLDSNIELGYGVASVNAGQDSFLAATNLYNNGYDVYFNVKVTMFANPNDFYYSPSGNFDGQWNLPRINMSSAWNLTKGSQDVVVGVSDSGTDYNHEDLVGNNWSNPLEIPGNGRDDDFNGYIDDVLGWDFWYDDNDPVSGSGNPHGTHVAGIIHGRSNNISGIAGIAGGWGSQKGASMMTLRMRQDMDVAIESLIYGVKNGAHVINTSWGTLDPFTPLEDILDYLTTTYNTVFVCASGNLESYPVAFPAAYDSTIAVGSSSPDDLYAHDSYGEELDLVAPKYVITTDITGTEGVDPNNLAIWWNEVQGVYSLDYMPSFGGTSSSAPHVTGAVALMLSLNPGLTLDQVRSALHSSADKVGGYDYNWNPAKPGHSLKFGYGRLDVYGALLASQNLPAIHVTSPNGGDKLSFGGSMNLTWERNNYTGTVALELHDDEGYVLTIASSLTGNSFNWSNPGNLQTGRNYRIKIKSNTGAYYDYSDRPFAIEGSDVVSIPDPNFLAALIDDGVDVNGDGMIVQSEADSIISLDVSNHEIDSLYGLQEFDQLRILDCSHNRITELTDILTMAGLFVGVYGPCDVSIDFSYNHLDADDQNDACELMCYLTGFGQPYGENPNQLIYFQCVINCMPVMCTPQ